MTSLRNKRSVTIHAWCDGACDPNPGPGGAGALLICGAHRKEIHQDIGAHTTNSRAELMAVLIALESIKSTGAKVIVHSDSRYVTDTLSGQKNARVNRDLMKRIRDVIDEKHLLCVFEWVRGHSGIPEQETSHNLARLGLDLQKWKMGVGNQSFQKGDCHGKEF